MLTLATPVSVTSPWCKIPFIKGIFRVQMFTLFISPIKTQLLSFIQDPERIGWTVRPLQKHSIRTIMALITFTSGRVSLQHSFDIKAKHFPYISSFLWSLHIVTTDTRPLRCTRTTMPNASFFFFSCFFSETSTNRMTDHKPADRN